jgi:mono/diheme cytochrome c family protein
MTPALLFAVLLPASAQAGERWYQPAHAAAGKPLYDTHCAECHQPGARGTPDWRERGSDGLLPPPPLNGTAHAWHHPLSVLYKQIMEGSAPGVGTMPAMKGKLSRGEVLAVIAYFQSLWSDEIYQAWRQVDESSKKGGFGQ